MRKEFLNFPLLREDEEGKLLGGFSPAFSADSTQEDKKKSKSGKYNPNCHGGNCKAGCGAGRKRDSTPEKNTGRCSNNCKMNCGC